MKRLFLLLLTINFARADGGPGTALHFIDAFDSVSVPHTNALNAYPFTVTAWFQWQSVPGPDPTDLIRKHDGAFNGWRIQIVNDRLYASYFASGSSYVWDGGFGLDGGFVADPLWHHLAFTVDASGGKLYVDGGLMASLAWTGTPAAPTTTQNLFLCGSDPPGARDFRLDEVMVWNVALTQAQIQTNRNRSLTGNESGLLAYYRCDEGSGTTLTDSAPVAGNNDGTLLGALFANSGIRPFTPFAQTLAATAIGATNATLNGVANPVATNTSARFEWGTTTNYGNSTSAQSVGSGISNTNFNRVITGLLAGGTHHFRAVVSNSLGLVTGTNQSFTIPLFTLAITNLPDLSLGSAAWGDYDNDGWLDLLLCGTDTNGFVLSDVWQNNTSGFDQIFFGLTGVTGDNWPGAAAWGDFDRNGRLDIALAGSLDGTAINNTTEVWANHQGGFSRINLFSPAPPNLVSGTVEWGDYDNDGRLDLLLAGYEDTVGYHCDLWRNSGTSFDLVAAALPPFDYGTTDWGDYDNDGDLDLLLAGQWAGTQLLRQQAGGAFTNVASEVAPGLPNLGAASVAWGDFDNDGRLDFLIAGLDGANLVSQLWRNTGSTFTNVPIPGLQGIYFGSLAWGDCDNDGRLDFLITGGTNIFLSGPISEVWRNTGSGFTNLPAGLPGVLQGTAVWGDYDNDGRLDIALMGKTVDGGRISRVYRNQSPVSPNSPPSSPTGLSMNYTNGTAVLSWNAATDTATSASGLTYNVRIGTASGLGDLLSPDAATNGFRRLPAMGNAQMRRYALVKGLNQGQVVYWSVQAVDTSFAGGLFSTEMSWTVGPLVETLPAVILGATTVSLPAVVNPDVTSAWFEWGATTTNLGFTTPVQLIGSSGFTNIYQVLNGLTVGTTYYFRAVGSNSLGIFYGVIQSFASVGFASIQPKTNGLVEMNLGGLSGSACLIEASTNLSDWKLIACLYASNSPAYFVDPETAWFDKRFYRFGTFPASLQSLFHFVDNHTNFFSVLFRHPSFSGSTAAFVDTSPGAPNFAAVTKSFPGGTSATNVLQVSWAFTNGAVNPWVRLSTSNAGAFGNPTLDFSHGLCFDFYTDRDLYLALGLRETDTSAPIGTNGGTIGPIEWVGGTVNNAVSPPLGRLITAGQWHQVCFFPPAEPVKAFTGNGILTSTTGRGVFEHLAIVPINGTGVFNLYFGDFQTFAPTGP